MSSGAHARERRFRGEPAVELVSGALSAVFVPDVGMTGVSLRYHGGQHLALPGGLDALRAGRTGGLPLLAPWANRLSGWRYRAAGVTVDLDGLPLPVDDNGLPIHGFLVGRPGWAVEQLATRGDAARLRAAMTSTRRRSRSRIASRSRRSCASRSSASTRRSCRPGGGRCRSRSAGIRTSVCPARPASAWRLRLPDASAPHARRSRDPDRRRPCPKPARVGADRAANVRRRLRLGRDRRLAIENDAGQSVELRCGAGYPFAQVWVPRGQAVRRARADGRADQRAGRPHGTRRPPGRRLHRDLHA